VWDDSTPGSQEHHYAFLPSLSFSVLISYSHHATFFSLITLQHARYLVREFRILVYKQFLESYKSVMVATMAQVRCRFNGSVMGSWTDPALPRLFFFVFLTPFFFFFFLLPL
jgi:hypothetical protein